MPEFPVLEWFLKGPMTLGACLLVVGFLWYRVKIQEERMRVHSEFIGEIFRRTALLSKLAEGSENKTEQSVFYNYMLSSVAASLAHKQSISAHRKFLLTKYNLFWEESLGGFNQIYEDMYINLLKEELASDPDYSDLSKEDIPKLRKIVEHHNAYRNKLKG